LRSHYGNPEIIALHQDADLHGRGTKGGRRVQGNDLERCKAMKNKRPGWSGGTTTSCTNVWVRDLFDGSTALIFINAGANDVEVVCDERCLVKAGLRQGSKYYMRDLIARKDLGDILLDKQLVSPQKIPGDGGSILIKLSKHSMFVE